jgi:hypothetical protein
VVAPRKDREISEEKPLNLGPGDTLNRVGGIRTWDRSKTQVGQLVIQNPISRRRKCQSNPLTDTKLGWTTNARDPVVGHQRGSNLDPHRKLEAPVYYPVLYAPMTRTGFPGSHSGPVSLMAQSLSTFSTR